MEKVYSEAEREEIKQKVQAKLESQGIPVYQGYNEKRGNYTNLDPLNDGFVAREGIDDIYVNENGNVQVTLRGYSGTAASKNANGPTATLTFKYEENPTGTVNRVEARFINGSGDTSAAAPDLINNGLLESNNDFYAVSYPSASGGVNGGLDDIIKTAEGALGLENNGRNIYGGASAGATTVLTNAKADEDGVFDMVLCDAAFKDGKTMPFVDALSSDRELMETMHKNNDIIYAYEATDCIITGTPGKAIEHLVKLAGDEEFPITVIVGVNDSLTEHAITKTNVTNNNINANSTEDMIINGTLSNVVHGFDSTQLVSSTVYRTISDKENETNGTETKYFYLNTNEFLTGDWKEVPNGTNGYTIVTKSDGRDLSHTEAELSNYINSLRSEVSETFMNFEQIKDIEKYENNNFSNLAPILSGLTYNDYSTIVDKANNIIEKANQTTCANKGISDYAFFDSHENGKIDYPDSLNTSNAFIYDITAGLLSDIKIDMTSLQHVLEGKVRLEEYLVKQTELLTDGASISTGANVDLSKVISVDERNQFFGVFSEEVKIGNAGKVSLADIQKSISSDGVLMSGLSNEISDADKMIESIKDIIGSTSVGGDDWKAVKDQWELYLSVCQARKDACETMKRAYLEAGDIVSKYIAPDEYLDDGEIPEYVEKINNLTRDIDEAKARIESLQASNASLRNVGPDCVTWYDEKGFQCTYCDFSPVYAAQDQIAANNQTIAVLNAQINVAMEARKVAQEKLDKLNGFAEVIGNANRVIYDAMNEVSASYGNAVSRFTPVVC